VTAAAGTYTPTQTFTILTASGGVAGKFGALTTTSNLAFLSPFLTYPDANSVALAFTQTQPFLTAAATPNQRAAAAAVQSIAPQGPLYAALVGQTTASARAAFDALSGEAHASAVTAGFEDSRFPREAILNRLASADRDPLVAASPQRTIVTKEGLKTIPGSAPVQPAYAVWGEGFGDWGRNGGNGNAATLNRSIGGAIFGIDTNLVQPWRIGVASGFTTDRITVRDRNSSGEFRSIFGSLYAGLVYGPVDFKIGGAFAGDHTTIKRTIAFPGFFDATSTGYDGYTSQLFGELGARIAFGPLTIEPIVSAAAIHLHQNGFRESGGAAALVGFGRGYDMQTTTVGLRGEIEPIVGAPLVLRGLLGWRHGFGDLNPQALLAFASGGNAFAITGAPIARDAAAVEAILEYRATAQFALSISYSGQYGRLAQDNAVKGGVVYKF